MRDKAPLIKPRKMRIGLFLSSRPVDGGAFQYSRSVLEAVSALPPSRFEVVVCYRRRLWTKYLREYEAPSFYSHPGFWSLLSSKRLSRYVNVAWWRSASPLFHSLSRTLIERQCALWIFPSQDTWTYLIPVRSLGTIYDLMHKYEQRFTEVSMYGLYKTRERHYSNMCRWAKGILVDSSVGKHHVMESYGVNPNRLHILPYVAPTHLNSKKKLKDFENPFQLPRKFIFYPAQFWEHKNHKNLVRAAFSLKEEIPELSLVFAGSKKNSYESTYELVGKLGLSERTHFLGYVPDEDMPKLYRRARAMIMPTFFGPTNIPPLEAMALGCPVAVSRIYGMPEQLGDAAVYFDPSSISEIAGVLKRLWTDDALCADLSRRGLIHTKLWNQSHFNERLQSIIEQLTAQLEH